MEANARLGPSVVGWRRLEASLEAIASRLEAMAIAGRLEAIASRLEEVGGQLVGWRPLLGWEH